MKEILADSAILSLLIIAPMAFLGPGWRSKNPDSHVAAQRFQREHQHLPGETTGDSAAAERDIPILRAFKDDSKGREDRE